jgi:glucokinase-like ROK family protein
MLRRKVDNRGMREINRTVVLDIIRQSSRISRTDLARRSALTKPTVSAIVEELMREGVVHEIGFSETAATGGRPARLLELNGQSAAYVGVHFGVRRTAVAVADARGVVRVILDEPTVKRASERSIAAFGTLLDEALEAAHVPRSRVQALGVAVPGPVEQRTGICVVSPNLGWHNVAVRDILAAKLSLPVVVHNEAHAAAIAEGRVGAAEGVRSYVWLYVGAGVGAGIVVDRALSLGYRGFGGEIGHCAVVANGRVCGCGRHGCLETVASATAIARSAREALAGSEPTTLRGERSLDAAAVVDAARAGDAVARRILADVAEHLGKGISYLVNILDPEMIVVGGLVADAQGALFEPLEGSVARHAIEARGVRIVPSVLGDQAEIVGAVLLAMDHVRAPGGAAAGIGTAAHQGVIRKQNVVRASG